MNNYKQPATHLALETLQQVFGYKSFRGQQAEIIDEIIAGRDALVLMPTGAGKSLCYQIPGLVRQGTTVVISPLIALMQDQVDALQELGVTAASLDSSKSDEERRWITNQALQGQLKFLYIAPERLLSAACMNLLKRMQIALFAIDEAHCVAKWGHDFRPDYLKLSVLPQYWPQVPRLALTATATHETREEIIQNLQLQQAKVFISDFNRPNIKYEVEEKVDEQKQLLNFISLRHYGDSGIVYCLSRKKTEKYAEFLRNNGINALPYHAQLSHEVRADYQRRFQSEDNLVMVATIAFGMGINKPNVRFVAHVDIPKSLEAYYQETGRAGRDGLAATAWMVYGLNDVQQQRRMIYQSDGDDVYKERALQALNSMLAYCESSSCRRQLLLNYFGQTAQPCGDCDICLNPPTLWDGTIAAQKVMSTIYRLNQSFHKQYGSTQIIDILQGKETNKVRERNFNSLSVFGVGKDLSTDTWRSVIQQLLVQGYLKNDVDGFQTLALTKKSIPVLKSQQRIRLRAIRQPSKNRLPSKQRVHQDLSALTLRRFDALRQWRHQLALAHKVPAYRILKDETLIDIAKYPPENLEELREVDGIGEHKLRLYGAAILLCLQSVHTQYLK
ncbi:DNA helicase RecQ [Brackiella oedipodis]|uniref:DNA helicase RecQ n=1 Tax=Brackiella oedipodis TaxID=124225 RepID=UPI00048BA3BC|nr:DNA helicase RecQ [Brackiella oedipodis]